MDLQLRPLTARRFFVFLAVTLLLNLFSIVVGAQPDEVLKASPAGMTAEQMASVSAAVVAMTQMVKWMGLPDKRGPFAVVVLAAIGVGLFGWSQGAISRASSFNYFAAGIMVATSAAGVFGFTRAIPEAVTRTTGPPSGAGASPTA